MTLTTKLLSALAFLVLLAPAYSGLLSSGHPKDYTAAPNTTEPDRKATMVDAYQRADISSSLKNQKPAAPFNRSDRDHQEYPTAFEIDVQKIALG